MSFINDNFLLHTEKAHELYNAVANLPIIDYHSHLDPQQIAENQVFDSITKPWLYGDHYKWRAMRTVGIKEKFITGDASDYEKFEAWAQTVPKMLRNPLYHWTHLELFRVFGITELLSPETAKNIWDKTERLLKSPGFGARDLLIKQGVKIVCTTDDPSSDLKWHKKLNKENLSLKMYPTWRPEKAMKLLVTDLPFNEFLDRLRMQHSFFNENGCRLSDYSVESFAPAVELEKAKIIYEKVQAGDEATSTEKAVFASTMLIFFAKLDAKTNWVRQLHIGALRNPNQAMFKKIGADTGFDAIDDFNYAKMLAEHLSILAETDELPRTIVYNLNPKDNEMLATLCGSFQDGTPGGRLNFGAAWWFMDQMTGMKSHYETLGALGCLSQFPGMLTDSRSVLSVPRHDYFRRLLCGWLADDIENGIIPNDMEQITNLAKNMCYNNAQNYFNFA